MDWLVRLYDIGIEADQVGRIAPYSLQRNHSRRDLAIEGKAFLNERRHVVTVDEIKKDEDGQEIRTTKEVVRRLKWECDINTVDSFQGEEKEIIIISLVRNARSDNSSRGLQFLNDKRRFNVTVSRAKWLVILIGDLNLLESSDHWRYELAKIGHRLEL